MYMLNMYGKKYGGKKQETEWERELPFNMD